MPLVLMDLKKIPYIVKGEKLCNGVEWPLDTRAGIQFIFFLTSIAEVFLLNPSLFWRSSFPMEFVRIISFRSEISSYQF